MVEDTISAVITALGEGAVGIVRISGTKALDIAEQLFKAKSARNLVDYPVHTLVYGHVYDFIGNVVDEVLAVYMKAPHSYTAEDVVEIQCHGGVEALKEILALTYKAGARPAEPGEFTKRAFLNGRIDLTQAEAVMDIIRAKSEASLKLAVRQQKGALSESLRVLRKALLDIIVNLEAVIDYPEEDIEDVTYDKVSSVLSNTCFSVEKLLEHAHTGKILREGLRTAIVGRPNVGKSSLLNALLKEDRAIVSDFAGTTRDVIEEQLLIDGIPVVLSDTAGIRSTEDFVEKIGVERSRQALEDAELVICVLDGSMPLESEDYDILNLTSNKSRVLVVNKADILNEKVLEEITDRAEASKILLLSAKTKAGLEDFCKWLKNYVYGGQQTLAEGIYVQNQRQENLLRQALSFLIDANTAADNMLPYDCIVIDVRNALDLLGEITGDTLQDEVINEIFSRFCIGK